MERHFLSSFGECRTGFLAAVTRLAAAGLVHERGQLPIPRHNPKIGRGVGGLAVGVGEEPYAVDFAFLSARPEPEAVLCLSCGLHGAEGHAGSAVMRAFLEGPALELVSAGLGVLAFHGLNPYGFDHFRRTTESNVDLNRNFDTDGRLYTTENEVYDRLHPALAPAGAVTPEDLLTERFGERLLAAAGDLSGAAVAGGMARGQYTQEQGLYYGGRAPEALVGALRPLLTRLLAGAARVLSIDLHTGFGERGVLHFFPDAAARSVEKHIERLFSGCRIDWGDTGSFYSVTGEFVNWIGAHCRKDALYVPMIFEMGTLDSHTPAGALLSTHTLVLENQAHFYGCESDALAEEVARRFRAMFYPDDLDWRESVALATARALALVLPRLLVGS